MRLKKVAAESNALQEIPVAKVDHDPWADEPVQDDSKFNFLPKPKPVVAPASIKQAPVVLTANGKPVPAVKKPDPGISYNPVFQDWDRLLTTEGEKAVEAEKKRLEEQAAEEKRLALVAAAQAEPEEEAKPDDESEWEGFESEYEATPEWLNKKRAQRKTPQQRNRAKRRKEAERKAKWEESMKRKEEQLRQSQLGAKKEGEEGEENEDMQVEKRQSDEEEEGDDRALRRRPLGRH
ncbi:hypothetical protein KEM55_001523, partial [Ascosphaera atra]